MSTEQLAEVALFGKDLLPPELLQDARMREAQQFAADLRETICTLEVLASHPAFAGNSAEAVALRGQIGTARIRFEALEFAIDALWACLPAR